jgi:hypothetical protein
MWGKGGASLERSVEKKDSSKEEIVIRRDQSKRSKKRNCQKMK